MIRVRARASTHWAHPANVGRIGIVGFGRRLVRLPKPINRGQASGIPQPPPGRSCDEEREAPARLANEHQQYHRCDRRPRGLSSIIVEWRSDVRRCRRPCDLEINAGAKGIIAYPFESRIGACRKNFPTLPSHPCSPIGNDECQIIIARGPSSGDGLGLAHAGRPQWIGPAGDGVASSRSTNRSLASADRQALIVAQQPARC